MAAAKKRAKAKAARQAGRATARRRTAAPRTAAERRETATAEIDSPWDGNGRDRVTVVVDTIELLRRRRRLDDASYAAARRYRQAWDTAMALPGGLAAERVDGGGGPSAGLSAARVRAAHDLAEAHAALGSFAPLVTFVVGHGHSLEDLARRLYGEGAAGAPKRDDLVAATGILRLALTVLANRWWPDGADGPRANLDRLRRAVEAANAQ